MAFDPVPMPYTHQITINYHETATSSITDLTGTKWLFNSTLTIGGKTDTIDITYNLNFKSNNIEFSILRYSATGYRIFYRTNSSDVPGTNAYIGDMPSKPSGASMTGSWSDEAYRTISITGGTDVTNSDLITWLQANATQIEDPEPTPSNPNLNDIFTDVANAIRSKTGKSGQLYPVNFANEIAAIETGGGGAELNIHYSSTTAPSDTSKLWVKTDTEPEKVLVSKDLPSDAEAISTLSATLPTATSPVASGVVGTKVYLFGEHPGSNYLNKIYCFDTETETITTLSATLPTATDSMASGVVGTKVYLFGGWDGSNYSNKIYRFDTTTETITTLSTTLPTVIGATTSGVVGTKVYLFGGWSGSNYLNKIYCFDTTTETITTLSRTLPVAITDMVSGVVGTKVYLFGGHSGTGIRYIGPVDTIYRFDTETSTITTLSATLPTVIDATTSGVVGTKIYLFGGYESGNSYSSKIYCFDTETETISTLSTTLPTATCGMASGVVGTNGVVGTKIYLFGGSIGNYNYSNKIYRFIVSFALPENNLLLLDTGSTSFNIVNSNSLVIEAKPKQVYIGDSNDIGEYVESALYVNGSWQPIG